MGAARSSIGELQQRATRYETSPLTRAELPVNRPAFITKAVSLRSISTDTNADSAAWLQGSLNLVREFDKTAVKKSRQVAQDDATSST